MNKLKVVLVGYGYWGPNLARNVSLNPKFEILAIVDQDLKNRSLASASYNVETYDSIYSLPVTLHFDLAIICTRPSSHLELAKHLINLCPNILITKPCGTSSIEAEEISSLAISKGVKVFCDFTYHFSPLVNHIIANKDTKDILTKMREYNSYRTSLGIVQADVDVLADLAVHDIYILLLLRGELPLWVSCLKTNSMDNSGLHSAFLTLTWEDGFVSGIHVSWNSPKKVRQISLIGEKAAIVIEEMNRETPLQIIHFETSGSQYELISSEEKTARNVSYTMGEIEAPKIQMYEALAKEIDTIADAINCIPTTIGIPSALEAASVWKVVEALRRSINGEGGKQYVHK